MKTDAEVERGNIETYVLPPFYPDKKHWLLPWWNCTRPASAFTTCSDSCQHHPFLLLRNEDSYPSYIRFIHANISVYETYC
jgi:hypothetical protein